MKRIFSFLRDIEFLKHVLPALLFGASLGIFVHGYWLIDLFPVDTRSLLFFTLLVSLIGMTGYILLFQWMTDALHGLSNFQKMGVVAASLFVGTFLFFTVTANWQKTDRYISLFLPTHTLEISIPPALNTDQVSILWMTTSLGDTSYETIKYDGWDLKGDRLVLKNISKNQLIWIGKPGDEVQIVFETPSPNGYALLSWDGQEQTLHFSKKKNPYLHTFSIPFYASQSSTLLLGILNFALLSLPLCFLVWKKRVEILRAVNQNFSPGSQQVNQREWIVILALMALVVALRVPNLEILFPSVEEYSHINAAKQIIQGVPIDSVYQRSLWLVTLPVSLMFRIFGYKLWAARLLGVLFNTLAVIPLYLITRKINRSVAVLSALLFATSPWIIATSRVVREYAYYPFYYFWIVYGMILFLEEIPDRFHIDRDWKVLLKPKILLLGLSFAIPLMYLRFDFLSTFRVILVVYLALGTSIFLKIDARYWKNLPLFIGVILMIIRLWPANILVRTTINTIPLHYFFLNSLQQWYFNRVAIIPILGLLGAVTVAVLLRRVNFIPLFLLVLYTGSVGFFMLSTNRSFAPRHLSTTQLWYVILVAIGLYLIWIFLQTFSIMMKKNVRIITILVLTGIVMNFQQVLVPVTSRNPSMPITEDYHNDLTDLQAFMLANVKTGDILISSRIYSRYVEWVDKPVFQKMYDFQVQSTENDVLTIVDQYDSGWIIIDNARIERATFSPGKVFLDNDRIEYVGLFDDEHVWRWGIK